jgi:hypothetical protein
MNATHRRKARMLLEANFWMAGVGHFDLTIEDTATVLSLLEKEDLEGLKKLYEKLSEQRMD